MPRYRILVEYDGGPFVGWQVQDNGPSVAGVLAKALAELTGSPVVVNGAGRTDAGVHARGQVAHFDLGRDWDPFRLREGMNAHLRPHPVSVLEAEVAAADFHARFSAVRRDYAYVILNRRAPPALARGRAWHVNRPLDAAAMDEAARQLVGHHDFTTFRSAECQAASPVRTLDRLEVTRTADEIVVFASARSFLHNQVRSMVGSLKVVGEGRWLPADVGRALAARDRAACGPVAPPDGLCLEAVHYGAEK
jgi:tRNA pseudouridine38-40 synthase